MCSLQEENLFHGILFEKNIAFLDAKSAKAGKIGSYHN
jgi:hypothetical protein